MWYVEIRSRNKPTKYHFFEWLEDEGTLCVFKSSINHDAFSPLQSIFWRTIISFNAIIYAAKFT